MIFYSIPFLILFTVSSILLHCSKNTRQQHLVIVLTNFIFYGYWDIRFLLLLVLEIGLCYALMLAYTRNKRRIFVIAAVIACLAVLGVFKYCNFFLDSLSRLFRIRNTVTLRLVIPLGVSFYTFQMLSYILDVSRGVIPAERDFVKLTAYLSFFPQITSGPIVKARAFLPQLDVLHRIKKENIASGIPLILLGLTKKIVFADRLGVAVDTVFSVPNAYSGISILFAALGFAMQIYCDFSGYSDMAIGIARIWDFDLGKNFNMPYLARNPSDFWRRWHISLSSWFQEYVYIPLGGSRNGAWKTYRNLLITMLLSGIWHGANWTFVVWGVFHGLYSIVHKLWKATGRGNNRKTHPVICTVANALVICLSWIVFRADSLGATWDILTGLFRSQGIFYINIYTVVFSLLMVLGNVYACRKNNSNAVEPVLDFHLFKHKLLLALWIFLIAMFAYVGDSAFIYAQF